MIYGSPPHLFANIKVSSGIFTVQSGDVLPTVGAVGGGRKIIDIQPNFLSLEQDGLTQTLFVGENRVR